MGIVKLGWFVDMSILTNSIKTFVKYLTYTIAERHGLNPPPPNITMMLPVAKMICERPLKVFLCELCMSIIAI